MQATWKPHEKHGELTAKADLPDTVFAFPNQRKEPLTDAKHVRNAVARFDQVTDVSDEDRALAFANIKKAAEHYDVELTRDVMARPRRPSASPSQGSRRQSRQDQTRAREHQENQRQNRRDAQALTKGTRRPANSAGASSPHFSPQPVSEGDRQRLHAALQRLFRQRLVRRAWNIGRGRPHVYRPAAQHRDASHPVWICRSAIAQIERVDTHAKPARRPRPESLGKRARQGLLHPARGGIADISHQRRRIDTDGAARPEAATGWIPAEGVVLQPLKPAAAKAARLTSAARRVKRFPSIKPPLDKHALIDSGHSKP